MHFVSPRVHFVLDKLPPVWYNRASVTLRQYGADMVHTMFVLLIAFLGVDAQGVPTVQYETRGVYMRMQECQAAGGDMMRAARGQPRINVQCLPVEHGMIW